MSMEELWYEAIKTTEIVRLPMKKLLTFGMTSFDYVILSQSLVNEGDTVVRKGRMDIDKPQLLLPRNMPQFEGFQTEASPVSDEDLMSFFYVRGISFPSLKYRNEPYDLSLYEGSLVQAEKTYVDEVRTREDVGTGVVIGNDDSWQFSVILLGCHMIENALDADLKAIIERVKKRR